MRNKRWLGTRLPVVLLLAVLGLPSPRASADPVAPAALALVPGRNEVSLGHEGQSRTAVIFVPEEATRPDSGWPVVLMLHGAGGSARNVENVGWHQLGAREGFITIYANGTPVDESKTEGFFTNPQTWNAGPARSLAAGARSAAAKGVDDVGYLMALLDAVAAALPTDGHRVYVAGHSNGAAMAMRLASERPERFAAAGVVAGHLGEMPEVLAPPVPLLQIVGSEDPFVPLAGGEAGVLRRKMTVPPAIETPRRWARSLGVADTPSTLRDDASLRIVRWEDGQDPARTVELVVVKGHGHEWPGHDSRLPGFLMGPSTNALDATETIWRFFRDHPKSGSKG